ncbi:MAG: STAS domain-containing protein, partial [Bacteroidales bacterium]|nr:STAS domain-containing protein [Bacteroidales bacterium]
IRSQHEDTKVVLSGVKPEVADTLIKAGFEKLIGKENICPNINVALARAEELL